VQDPLNLKNSTIKGQSGAVNKKGTKQKGKNSTKPLPNLVEIAPPYLPEQLLEVIPATKLVVVPP